MKLSDFLKQQGDTPQGKSVYQAFIDNFDDHYNEKAFGNSKRDSIADAFEWATTNEGELFWCRVDTKWREVENTGNDMLWLLDGKEPPQEADEELNKQKEYPRWFKYKGFGKIIIEFLDLTSGIVVDTGTTNEAIGTLHTGLWPHTNSDVWQEVPSPELTQEKRTPIDDNEIDRLLDEVNNIDGKNHLDTILAERGAKYGSFTSQAAFAQYIAGYAELIVKELNGTTIKG